MTIGINWKDIWKAVWKPVWRTTAPPVAPPLLGRRVIRCTALREPITSLPRSPIIRLPRGNVLPD